MSREAPTPPKSIKKYEEATRNALIVLDDCYDLMSRLSLPQSERIRVAISLMFGSIEQARSACLLIANDADRSTFAAFILLRSQIDQMLRGMFFAGPANDDQLAYYLDKDEMPKIGKIKAHPVLLAEINDNHYGWAPKGKIQSFVVNHWKDLCGFTHGGHALLGFYAGGEGISPMKPTDELIEVVCNTVTLCCITIQIIAGTALNKEEPEFKKNADKWAENALEFLNTWQTPQESSGEET